MNKIIKEMVDKYSLETGTKIECITVYYAFNEKLVNENRLEIIDFFNKLYGNNTSEITLSYLLKDQLDTPVFKIIDLEELEYFEKFVGLLTMAKILYCPLQSRIIQESFILKKGMVIFKEENKDYQDGLYYDYLNDICKFVIPNFKYIVNQDLLNYKERENDYKKSLAYWFSKTTLPVDDELSIKISNVINRWEVLLVTFIVYNMKKFDESTIRDDAIKLIESDKFILVLINFCKKNKELFEDNEVYNSSISFINSLLLELKNNSLTK